MNLAFKRLPKVAQSKSRLCLPLEARLYSGYLTLCCSYQGRQTGAAGYASHVLKGRASQLPGWDQRHVSESRPCQGKFVC